MIKDKNGKVIDKDDSIMDKKRVYKSHIKRSGKLTLRKSLKTALDLNEIKDLLIKIIAIIIYLYFLTNLTKFLSIMENQK